jgi:response regulator of citrate/malate metabolism
VIVLATIKLEKEVEKYREMGALDYLVKPVTYDEYVRVPVNIESYNPENNTPSTIFGVLF